MSKRLIIIKDSAFLSSDITSIYVGSGLYTEDVNVILKQGRGFVRYNSHGQAVKAARLAIKGWCEFLQND